MDSAYRDTLEIARGELDKLMTEESDLETRLEGNRTRQGGLKKTIDSLSALVGEEIDSSVPGVSEAIRRVLSTHLAANKKTFLRPIAIRNRLVETGFDLASYKNPMAVIHSTLKRLQDQGEVEPLEQDKKVAYRWIAKDDFGQGITDDDVPF
jgi:hypothetical protein